MSERYKVHICHDGTGWCAVNAAYQPIWSVAEAADSVADQLGPDDHADNSHDDRVVLAHPVAQAGCDISISATTMIGTGLSATPTARGRTCPMAVPIRSPGRVSPHAAEAEMTG
jgi:hypothetical protein